MQTKVFRLGRFGRSLGLAGVVIFLAANPVFAKGVSHTAAPTAPTPLAPFSSAYGPGAKVAPGQNHHSCPTGETLYGGACVDVTSNNPGASHAVDVRGQGSCPAGEHIVSPGNNPSAELAAYYGQFTCKPDKPQHVTVTVPTSTSAKKKAASTPSPKKAPSTTPPAPAPSPLPAAFVTDTVDTPWVFNGCMPHPVVPVVTPFYEGMGTTYDQVAPGEPENEVRIAVPTYDAVEMPPSVPGVKAGTSVGQYTAQASASLWEAMTQQGAIGELLSGPGWGIESEQLQNWLHTPFWHQGAAITNSKGVVTGHQAHYLAWNVTADGPPYWVARELFYVNACPYPIVTVTTN